MIKYSEVKEGESLRIVGEGAPGYAANGEIVKVKKVSFNSVTVENREGETANFVYDCGAARLEKIN
ncbi:hypothetical protein ACJDT4_13305 [Clostridium neuense]|uniref:KOW domain-containing protein n=1 Tax=Clostridium neuense TaxID=1728934 RepID=A0ABW8TFU4_9CLOT